MSPTELTYEELDHVDVITIDRPEARNALTFTTYAEIEAVVRGGRGCGQDAAVGWGMELALMADIRVASDRARFGQLFVKREPHFEGR
jgi:enoyl-CoA hydratase/carnithine racemase